MGIVAKICPIYNLFSLIRRSNKKNMSTKINKSNNNKKDMLIGEVIESMTLDRIILRKKTSCDQLNLISRGSITDPKFWN